MEIHIEIFLLSIVVPFQIFHYDYIMCIYFSCIAASSIVDDVTT